MGTANILVATTVTSSITSGGDGSAYNRWFLNEDDAVEDQSNQESWGEECIETVETFIGSDIYREAESNSNELNKDKNG